MNTQKVQSTEAEIENLENEICNYCDIIAKSQLELRKKMEKKYDEYVYKLQKITPECDVYTHHEKIKLIRRLSLLGLALHSANEFYGKINTARCN